MADNASLIDSQRNAYRHAQIAERMEQYAGRKVTADSVQKYLSGAAGVPFDLVGALLYALDLKVVQEDAVVLPKDEYDALQVFARKALLRRDE